MKTPSKKLEAYGYKYNNRDQRIVWRKVFPSNDALNSWADKNNATVIGTREIGPSDPGFNNPKYMKEAAGAVYHDRTADQLEIGDRVTVTAKGNQFEGLSGTIKSFGIDKKFVVVDIDRYGPKSFHSSDVQEPVTADDLADEIGHLGDDGDEVTEFFVTFYDERRERYWIGKITKDGGKWVEKPYKGDPDYRWGQRYMSYLSPQEVVSWIEKDYARQYNVGGPFYTVDELKDEVEQYYGAKLQENKAGFSLLSNLLATNLNENRIGEHEPKFKLKSSDGMITLLCCGKRAMTVSHEDWADLIDAVKNRTTGNFGGYTLQQKGDSYSILHSAGHEVAYISASEMDDLIYKSMSMVREATEYTDFNDWKQAVLNSYPAQAKRIKFKGRMEGSKMTISAEIPGEDRSYGVWDEDKGNGVVLTEEDKNDGGNFFNIPISKAAFKEIFEEHYKLDEFAKSLDNDDTVIDRPETDIKDFSAARNEILKIMKLAGQGDTTSKPVGWNLVLYDDPITPGAAVIDGLKRVMGMSDADVSRVIRDITARKQSVLGVYVIEDKAVRLRDSLKAAINNNNSYRGGNGTNGPWDVNIEVLKAG